MTKIVIFEFDVFISLLIKSAVCYFVTLRITVHRNTIQNGINEFYEKTMVNMF